VSERLTDDQVAWYAGTSRTAKWTADMAVHENIVTLAREVQAHRSSCECAPMADQLTVARNEFAAYRCKVEAQIEVLELTIGRLRCVCDAAFTVVREDGDEDGWTAWQELVSALEDARYEVRS
jgi:hypothetical protein